MSDWKRPRRPEKGIISYLTQIEPVVDAKSNDTREADKDDDDVGHGQVLDNVLDELRFQTASVMQEKNGSVVVEKLARQLAPRQLRRMLSRCRGYMLSLATNRYSSHVLQTLLSLVGPVVDAEAKMGREGPDSNSFNAATEDGGNDSGRDAGGAGGGGGDEDASVPEDVPSMSAIVTDLAAEMVGSWADLASDISGSHTGRALLCVLGGLPVLAEKRGKNAKHQTSIGVSAGPRGAAPASAATRDATFAAANAAAAAAMAWSANGKPGPDPDGLLQWSAPCRYATPLAFAVALNAVIAEISSAASAQLQAATCDAWASPLLVMLLRVCANAVPPSADSEGAVGDVAPVGSTAAAPPLPPLRPPGLPPEEPAMALVERVLEWEDDARSRDIVYGMSGEAVGSRFLEAVVWLAPAPFVAELYERCLEPALAEYCADSAANFLVQALLQRCGSRKLGTAAVTRVAALAPELLRGGRGGVLWRAAEACVRLGLAGKTPEALADADAAAVSARRRG
ncbi:unnamed protein product, partial [Phaeothamnion confervicola]